MTLQKLLYLYLKKSWEFPSKHEQHTHTHTNWYFEIFAFYFGNSIVLNRIINNHSYFKWIYMSSSYLLELVFFSCLCSCKNVICNKSLINLIYHFATIKT